MARLQGWRAEGRLSNVIRDSRLFISHESQARVTIMRVVGGGWWSPGLDTDSHPAIDRSHDGPQSHLDLRAEKFSQIVSQV